MNQKLLEQIKGNEFRALVLNVLEHRKKRQGISVNGKEAFKMLSMGTARMRVSLDNELFQQSRRLPAELRDNIDKKLVFTLRRFKELGEQALKTSGIDPLWKTKIAQFEKAAKTQEAWVEYWRPIDPITGGCIVACIFICGMIVVWIVVEECFPDPQGGQQCIDVEVPVEVEVCDEQCEEQCPEE